jgi:trehalose-phosphatase
MDALNRETGIVARAANHVGHTLLFIASFDGVLAEYQSDPDRAQVTRVRLQLLRRLQQIPGVIVAVISGRPLADLRSRIPLGPEAFYIGLHGFEIAGPQFAWMCSEGVGDYQDRMRDVAIRLQEMIAGVPGVRLEWKGPIVAIHTREASPEDVVWSRYQLLSAAAELVNADVVRGLRGRDVLELLPNVDCPRAGAVRAVRRCVEERHGRPVFTVYIGEDVADDDALDAAAEDGVAAVVGRRTGSSCHFDSPDAVDALIGELITAREPGTSGRLAERWYESGTG